MSVVSNNDITDNGFTTSDSANYISDALEAIHIHFIDYDDNHQKKLSFTPKMAHQIFGNDELVFGYSNLTIDITYCGITAHALLKYNYFSKIEDKGLLSADDIQEKIKEWIPNIFTSKRKFQKVVQTTAHTSGFGKPVNYFKISRNDDSVFDCSVHLCDLSDRKFVEFHERYQSLIVFFIDAASYINLTDRNWTILYLYVKKNPLGKLPVGFLTIYKFVTPKITRSRISQVFIIPPYQRLGLGTKLLETAYEFINSLGDVDEITVESPSEEFTQLRDNYDLRLLTALPEFSRRNILKGYSPNMAKTAKTLFKINRTQCIHLVNILQYHYGRRNNLENGTSSEKLYKDMRRRFKASYTVQCKRKVAKTMKNLLCIQTLLEDFDVDQKLRDYLLNLAPTLKYLSNWPKKQP